MDAEHRRGAALVAVAMAQHFGEQGNFEFAQCDLVQVLGVAAIEVAQVAAYGVCDVLAQWRPMPAAGCWVGTIGGGVQADPLENMPGNNGP